MSAAPPTAEDAERILSGILVRYLRELREDRFSGPLELRISLKGGTALSLDATVVRVTSRQEETEFTSLCRKREWTRPNVADSTRRG